MALRTVDMGRRLVWKDEFNAGYDCPSEQLFALGFGDCSYRHDACPSFARMVDGQTDTRYVAWCDHPDPAQRDGDTQGNKRFALCMPTSSRPAAILYETDDLETFLKLLRVLDYCLQRCEDEDFVRKAAETLQGAYYMQTGGGIYVTYLSLTPTEALGISEECLVLYQSAQQQDLAELVFDLSSLQTCVASFTHLPKTPSVRSAAAHALAECLKHKETLDGLLKWTQEHPEMVRHIRSEAVMLTLIRYLQAQVSQDVADYTNQVLGICA